MVLTVGCHTFRKQFYTSRRCSVILDRTWRVVLRNRKVIIEPELAKLAVQLRRVIRILNFDYHDNKSPKISVSETVRGPKGLSRIISNVVDDYVLYLTLSITRHSIIISAMKWRLIIFAAPKPSGRRSRKPGIDRKPRQAYSAKQLERLEAEFKVRFAVSHCSTNPLYTIIFFHALLVLIDRQVS